MEKLGKSELAVSFYNKYTNDKIVYEGEKDFYTSFFLFVFKTMREEIIAGSINLHKLGSFSLKKRKKESDGKLESPYYVNITFSKQLKEHIKSEESLVILRAEYAKNKGIVVSREALIEKTVMHIRGNLKKINMENLHRKIYSKNILMDALAVLVEQITLLIKQGYLVDLEVKYMYVQENKKFGYVLGQKNNTDFVKSLNKKIRKEIHGNK